MLTRVWLGQASIPLAKLTALGQGGEADVYDLGDGRALKIFKTPDHPDVVGVPELERVAALRLAEQQDKLRAFPAGLPLHVVKPQELATRTKRRDDVAGYAMAKVDGEPLLRLAEPHWRRAHPLDGNIVVAALRHLHGSVDAVHRAGVVIGDFNDGNVLVAGERCWLIDTDSWQFGGWACAMFSERFVDPRLCAPGLTAPVLARPHDADGDWYAFAVMVFRSLLRLGPYGGVFAPADAARRVPQAARPLHRISVFDPEVVYPKAAVPWPVLPDELIEHFRGRFQDGRRGRFPVELLDRLRFRRCGCGAEHARSSCPVCRTSVVVPATAVRGQVRAAGLDPALLTPSSWTVGRAPAAGAPAVWLDGGTLWRQGALGAEAIGQVLAGHTRAWVGRELGVGLYRAGGYTVGFVFRPDRRGLHDGVVLPRIRGALLDVHAVVGGDRAWLWWREALGGRDTVHCVAISATGAILGTAEAPTDDAGWLGAVPGACAIGPLLFVPTDAGVVRIEATPQRSLHGAPDSFVAGPAPASATLSVTRTFPDTADFVTSADQLHPGPGGLDVATRDGTRRLTLS